MVKLELPMGSGIPLTRPLDVLDARPPLSNKQGTTTHILFIAGEQPGLGGAYYTSSITSKRETVTVLRLTRDKRGRVTHFTSSPGDSATEHRRIQREQYGPEAFP
ncbi:MAG TPA: hypothetical protein VN711_03030 [Candidatus Saccharimonadales bacterium]|nr:hypothetical protein [Candidatus Saccharimonadales bacterium]